MMTTFLIIAVLAITALVWMAWSLHKTAMFAAAEAELDAVLWQRLNELELRLTAAEDRLSLIEGLVQP